MYKTQACKEPKTLLHTFLFIYRISERRLQVFETCN